MNEKRLGCMSPLALTASIITIFVMAGVAYASGASYFSAGSLNAQTGPALGGVSSHAEISDCAKCHPAPWESDFMGDRCVQCHVDVGTELADAKTVHGAIKGDQVHLNCRTCHHDHRGPSAPLTENRIDNFPHAVTGFALTSHQTRTDGGVFLCSDCHPAGYQFDPALCTDCHALADQAFMVAHQLEYGKDCLACHDGVETLGKKFDHSKAVFALVGKHQEVLCSKCHINARKRSDLVSTPQDCQFCHLKDDAHERRYGISCGDCHNPAGWQDNVKFDHNLSVFKLVGRHAEVACEKCHINHVFQGTPQDCYSCHQKDDEHKGAYGTDCSACHTPKTWEGAQVDHSLFAFKLEGKHVGVACLNCHINNVFKGTPTACAACHDKDDAHRGAYGSDCAFCHTPNGWKPSTFSHNKTSFPLTGRHTSVACTSCHVNNTFAGTPNYCSGCHADPFFHRGMFGTNCESCHDTRNWDANYTGPHPNVGGGEGGSGIHHGGADCRDCHTKTLREATCTKCHDGNPGGDGGGGGGGGGND